MKHNFVAYFQYLHESNRFLFQVVDFSVALGKVAIHCHAGKGRTCALIACYLVYVHRVPASAAICYIRKHRVGSIQTRGQVSSHSCQLQQLA